MNGIDIIDDTSKEKIISTISNEIENTEDYGNIYNKNKDPIENWIKENIDKAREETINKFIVIPRLKTEYSEGNYYFDDFDLDLTQFTQKPISNDILISNFIFFFYFL